MRENETTLTVYFEPPFWVGVFARREGGTLTAAKVTFGAEPRDQEVYDLILSRYGTLRFSPPVAIPIREAADNPKRARRKAARRLQAPGAGTKSQRALQLQRELWKQERAEKSRAQKEEEARRRFALKQEKHREKRRGH